MSQDADTVQLRQVQVKDDYVVLELGGCGSSLFAIRHNIHRVMFAFETLANESRQGFIVFCNKNSHKSEPSLIQQASLVRNRSVAAKTEPTRRAVGARMALDFKLGDFS